MYRAGLRGELVALRRARHLGLDDQHQVQQEQHFQVRDHAVLRHVLEVAALHLRVLK